MSRPTIAHVDLDAFYASVEMRDDPGLSGRPVVVGGSSRRGVVMAASYEARRYGIHSAMPMMRARRLCPELVVVPPRMSRYAADSKRFFTILGHYSPLVEGLSLDEAFVDLTGTEALFGPPDATVSRLRDEVMDTLSLPCSAGIAPVKFVAKIASALAKPNGQLLIEEDRLLEFLHPLPVSRLWGVGKKREQSLKAAGLDTIGDIARADRAMLVRRFGDRTAHHLYSLANGVDARAVVPHREAKSMGAEETFERDLRDLDEIALHLLEQAERVAARLRRANLVAGAVTLKYKLSDFKLVTRQRQLPPTADGPTLHRAVVQLLRDNPPPRPVRLVGVSAHKLTPAPLGAAPIAADSGRTARLNAALDGIRQKHGHRALTRAGLLDLERRVPEELPAGTEPPPKPD